MASREAPYDPYIPSGQGAGAPLRNAQASNNQTEAIQGEIDIAVRRMQDNINKLGERGENLNALQDKTDNLATSAQGFRRGANRVRKQMWWKDMKMRICIIVGIIVLLLLIIVPIAVTKSK